jgi:perosamine synthetase
MTERLRRSGLLDRFTRYYDEGVIDMPADHLIGMTSLEARVGSAQVRKLADFIAARRAYAAFYREHLSDLPALSWIDAPEGSTFSHIAARVNNKQAVMANAFARGIQLGEVIEYSIPEMTAYRSMSVGQGPFPVAKSLSEQTINFPAFGRFSKSDAEKVVREVRKIILEDI